MSKFIDILKSVSSGGLPPLGFRAGGAKPHPKMLLVSLLAKAGAKAEGADAIVLSVPKTGFKPPKDLAKSDIPWGGWLEEVASPAVKRLGEAGADFVVFPVASAPQSVLEEEKLGKVLEVAPDLEAGLLRAVDDLPIDAVLIAAAKPSLSWQELMLFRRSTNILSKPLLVRVSPDITPNELQALYEAGVAGVVVESAKTGGIRSAIDKLTSPKAAKRRRVEPLVPRVGGGGAVAEEEEEEED